MKKYIFFWIALISAISSFSQSIQELDKRNGFKHFKFGEPKSKYLKYLKNPSDPHDGYTTYKYISDISADYSVFGNMFDGIMLAFDQSDKLSSMFIAKDYGADGFQKSLDDYKSILSNLMNLFGKPTKDNSEDDSGLSYHWTGSDISLYFTHTYKGASVGSTISIMFLSNSIDTKSKDF